MKLVGGHGQGHGMRGTENYNCDKRISSGQVHWKLSYSIKAAYSITAYLQKYDSSMKCRCQWAQFRLAVHSTRFFSDHTFMTI
jgi:hypothetical protein